MSATEPTSADDVTTDAPEELAPPEVLQARLVQRTAQVLPGLGTLPAPLRRVATFAPQRRARLGATQILASLVADAALRERVANRLVLDDAELDKIARLLDVPEEAAPDLADRDPLDVGVLAWLRRPAGWQAVLDAATTRVTAASEAGAAAHDSHLREQLERRVAALEAEVREQRAAAKAQHDELKAENTALRRKLGESRAAARAAVADAEQARADQRHAEGRVEVATHAAGGDVRRWQRRVEELQAQLSAQKAGGRAEREEASLRSRLLLDAVVASAQGLQRELGLRPAEGVSPAERYEADLVGEGSRTTTAAGSLGAGSPALLEQLLAMPRARLVVDGYNVTKQTWASSSLEVQRMRLVNGIAPIVARSGAETTVVFDAASSATRPVVAAPRGVRVAFSPENVIADDVIRDLVGLEPQGRVVVVVTSDQALARDVRRAGATVMDSVALAGLLGRA